MHAQSYLHNFYLTAISSKSHLFLNSFQVNLLFYTGNILLIWDLILFILIHLFWDATKRYSISFFNCPLPNHTLYQFAWRFFCLYNSPKCVFSSPFLLLVISHPTFLLFTLFTMFQLLSSSLLSNFCFCKYGINLSLPWLFFKICLYQSSDSYYKRLNNSKSPNITSTFLSILTDHIIHTVLGLLAGL